MLGRRLAATPVETAHGGAGWRRVLITEHDVTGPVRELTHGTLPPGGCFDWHTHEDRHEIMIVIEGMGTARSRRPHDNGDGDEFHYSPGDVVFLPAGAPHKITVSGEGPLRGVFLRYDATEPRDPDADKRDAVRAMAGEYGSLCFSAAVEFERGDHDAAVATQGTAIALSDRIINDHGPDNAEDNRAVRDTLREYGTLQSADATKSGQRDPLDNWAAERLLNEIVDLCMPHRGRTGDHKALHDAIREYRDLIVSEGDEHECGNPAVAEAIGAKAHAFLLEIADRYGQPR